MFWRNGRRNKKNVIEKQNMIRPEHIFAKQPITGRSSQTWSQFFSSVRFKSLLAEHVTRYSYAGPHEPAIAVTCQIVWLNDRMSEWIARPQLDKASAAGSKYFNTELKRNQQKVLRKQLIGNTGGPDVRLFVIYIRDSVALRFEPFKIMYENGSKIALNLTRSEGFK